MLLTTLATLGSIGASAYAAAKSARANRQAQEIENANYRDTDRILQSRLRSDYTSRTDFQNILTRQKALLDAQWKRVQGANAVAGSSGGLEAGAAQKQANALAMADTMGNLAAGASDYKDAVQQQVLANNAQNARSQANAKARQAQIIAQAGGQVTQAMGGIVQADNPAYDASILKMFGLTKQ
jgi:hypothetical protein